MEPEQRLIISGKVNRRSEEDPPALILDTVKPVDNSNIFTITLKGDFKFEELVYLKNLLCEHKGSDPVMLKVEDLDGVGSKILSASMFWVQTSNDLVNKVTHAFKDRLSVNVRSLDAKDPDKEQAA